MRGASYLFSEAASGRSQRRGIELDRCDLWRVPDEAPSAAGKEGSTDVRARLMVSCERFSALASLPISLESFAGSVPESAARDAVSEGVGCMSAGEAVQVSVIVGRNSKVELPVSDV